jgi:serine/threonine protein kinase
LTSSRQELYNEAATAHSTKRIFSWWREWGYGMAGSEGPLTGRTIGAYQVGNLIGAGQLAEVYQARHHALTQPVALKVFMPIVAAHEAFAASINHVAIHAARLGSGNILPIYSFAQEDEHLYLAMPLLHESLRSVLLQNDRLSLSRAAPLVRQIAQGLADAHTAGIIHRDLKPENVLLDGAGRAFISDFGIGRDLPQDGEERRSLGTLTSLIGTPAYMSPEQLRGQPTDERTDIYALAVIFYEMLVGTPPFNGNTIYEVASKALTTSIQAPTRFGAAIPPLFEQALIRALARDPTARWPSMRRFIAGINATLPPRLDAMDDADFLVAGIRRNLTTIPLSPTTREAVLAAADDAANDSTPPVRAADTVHESTPTSASGVLPAPDLRLFHVDPLPPMVTRPRSTRLLLAGVAVLTLLALGAGGVLLANAAQSNSNKGTSQATPTATSAPTRYVLPQVTLQPTARPTATHPPAPRPTATPRPKPTATTVASPSPSPTSSVVPSQ